MDITMLGAFLGGVLALLSPCAALLLPAFFGSTVGTGSKLIGHGLVFYLGMLLVLIPLGMGAGTLGALFADHRGLIVGIASLVLIVLGVVQFFGFGFDPAKYLPGAEAARTRSATATGWSKTFLLGATSGIAGVCSGPILGAVLTLAAAQGHIVLGGLMLAIYGAGMVVPLFIIAALWSRLGTRGRKVLRGGSVTVFGRPLPIVSMVTGLLLIAIGIVFWVTNGLVSAPSLVSTSSLAKMQAWVGSWSTTTVDIIVVCVLAALALLWWFLHERRRAQRLQREQEEARGQAGQAAESDQSAETGERRARREQGERRRSRARH